MTKANIQTTTREMKEESRALVKQIRELQDEVKGTVAKMQKRANELEEQKKQEQQKQRSDAQATTRMTAYVMPDDTASSPDTAEIQTKAPIQKENEAPVVQTAHNNEPMIEKSAVSEAPKEKIVAKEAAAKPTAASAGQAPSAQTSAPREQNTASQSQPKAAVAPQRTNAGTKPNAQQGQSAPRPSNNKPNAAQNEQQRRDRPKQADRDRAEKPVRNDRSDRPAANNAPPRKAPPRPGAAKPNYDNQKDRGNKKASMKDKPPSIHGDDERMGSRRRRGAKRKAQQKIEPIKIENAVITTENITVKELSEKLGKPAAELIKKLFLLGIMATINQEIDFDTAELLASEYDISLEHNVAKTAEEVMLEAADVMDDEENLIQRPPVVTIMGHVDHGKTSLLDAIRKAHVATGEAGGITQHIGAYTVDLDGRIITFLDTPGHEAFTAMRARGAQATDITILVVAADDGIMPQTVEAINHVKAAGVPIIVAINKMDKPEANPDRVMQQLTEHGLVVEEWGGDVIAVPVSAKSRMNLDKLLEMVLLVADVEDYRANPNRDAQGIIVEAQLDRGRGPVATVLVKNGTLHVGDSVIAGTAFGRVRAMIDDKGERVEEAGPSIPVEVLGLNAVPSAGDQLHVVESAQLREIAAERKDKLKAEKLQSMNHVSLDNLFEHIADGEMKDLNVIVKADVQGSVEAVKQSLEKLSNEEVRVRTIHGGVGAITETDVMFASASNAIIIGFNVRPEAAAREAVERENVDMRLYSVIYSAIEDIEAAMKGMLEPQFEEVALGIAEVRNVFKITGAGIIAGSYVTSGKITRGAELRLLRDNIVIHEGKIASVRRFKDDVKEVASGYECGISLENYSDVKEGDIIECYEMKEIER